MRERLKPTKNLFGCRPRVTSRRYSKWALPKYKPEALSVAPFCSVAPSRSATGKISPCTFAIRPFYFSNSALLPSQFGPYILAIRPFCLLNSAHISWQFGPYILAIRPFCLLNSAHISWQFGPYILAVRPFCFRNSACDIA